MARSVRFVALVPALVLACAVPRGQLPGAEPQDLVVTMGRDAAGSPVVRVAVAVVYRELIFERDPAGGFRSRILVQLVLQDDEGRQTGGDAWPFEVHADDYAQTRSATRHFSRVLELPAAAGPHTVVAGLQVLGSLRRLEHRARLVLEPTTAVGQRTHGASHPD